MLYIGKVCQKIPQEPSGGFEKKKKMTRNIPVVFVFLNLILLSLKEVSLTWLQAVVGAPVLWVFSAERLPFSTILVNRHRRHQRDSPVGFLLILATG